MNARIWKVAAALCLVASVGCSSSKDSGHSPAPAGPTITLNASTTTVVANGTNYVDLTVTDTAGVAVTVTTDRGTFSTGGQSVALAAGSGTTTGSVRLVTCNSATDVGCAGAATVTATSTTGQATRAVNFVALASACGTNCGSDAQCVLLSCTLTGGGTGRCSASSPSVCSSGTPANPNAGLGGFAIPSSFATPPIMGVKSSGWNEVGIVAVQVLDDQGQPYRAGLVVRFEHRQLGGSTFGPPLATTNLGACTAAADCVAYDATTADGGVASAPLFSGTVAGTLVVTATATVGAVTRSVTLPGIAVVGAKASGANFSIQCSPRNVPALAETDCSTSWVDAPFTCVAILKDRFDNLLGTQTQVIFASEAAAVGQVTWTPAYNPTATGDGQTTLGTATQIFQTLGNGLPFDVAPQAGEPSVIHALDGCGPRTHNPRDGVVTIIAIADGEEAFFDANGNGKYDPPTATTPGEPFVDQGEPFVDQNDNGVYDPGEWFLDVNGNGRYDGPNGVWDAQTKIWTQTVVVYTGEPAQLAALGGTLGTRWIAGASFTDACTATATPTFTVTAKGTGTPPPPPTTQSFVVVASDSNLNFLTTKTAYSVEVVGDAKVKATYRGKDSYADDLGMNFRYWPCDQGDPTATPAKPVACSSQCRAAVPSSPTAHDGTGPCVMTPSVSAFGCGVDATVVVTGGDEPDPGLDEIDWLVKTPWDVYLGSKYVELKAPISGHNN